MDVFSITKNDIAGCSEAFTAAYNQLPWNHNWKLDNAIKYLTEYADAPTFQGFMLQENNQVYGALLGHAKTWWTNNQFVVDEFFIDPREQGKGYGKLLLKHTEQYARERNLGLISLMTNKFMPAIHFYDKNDFAKVDQYVFMFKQL